MKDIIIGFRDVSAMTLLLAVYNVGAIFGWLQYYPDDRLWFPYAFLGIPAITVSGTLKWYNQIWVTWEASKQILLTNPLFAVMLLTLIFILYRQYMAHKPVAVLYFITLFVTILTTFTTDWSY